jgi:hypothetical protein
MASSKLPPNPSKLATPISSKIPAASLDAGDTGPLLFMEGQLYYRQLEDLALTLCVTKTITDAQWSEFLDGSLRRTSKIGRMPKVTMAMFTGSYPNAKQRRTTAEFLRLHGVKPIDRLGLLSDNPLVRGAVIAFHWVVPHARVLAFGSRETSPCLDWLHEVAIFDAKRASTAWNEGRAALKVR